MTEKFCRLGLGMAIALAAVLPLRGQSLFDAIDDPIDCSSGKATAGLLPAVVDIISIDIRKQNDDLVATVEFRGDPSIGDSVSGGIVALDPERVDPGSGSDWHFDNAGNVMFSYAGDAVSTRGAKFVTDSTGAWVADTTSSFTATRAGNVVIVRVPGPELGAGSLWMAFSSTRLFEEVPRCDAAGNDKDGFPILEVPDLVASSDTYQAIGNVSITVPAATGLLSNDIDVTSITAFDAMSTGGGTVAVDTAGGFVFSPAPGFKGHDVFNYTVTDGKGGFGTADVVIEVDQALWFVDAAAQPGPGSGTLSDPFADLISLASVSGTAAGPKPADAILIFQGQYRSELNLAPAQVIVGQAVDMLQVLQEEGFQFPLYADFLNDPPSVGEPPILLSDSLDAIRVSRHNRIYGVSIGDTPQGAAIQGDSVATLVVSDVSIDGRGAVIDVGKGQIDITLMTATSDSAKSDAILLREVDGSLTVGSQVLITGPGRDGIRKAGGTATLSFPVLHIIGADSGAAVTVEDAEGGIEFGLVEIRSATGMGITVAGGGTLDIAGGTIQTGEAALDLRSVQLDVRLDSVSSKGSQGMVFDGVSGSLIVDGRVSVDSEGVPALDVVGSSVTLAFGEILIDIADASFGIRVSQGQGSVLRFGKLMLFNERGGGIEVGRVDSVKIGTGSIATMGGPAVDLSNLTADVYLDSVVVDSAETAIVLRNVGGLFRIGQSGPAGRAGSISRISGPAVEVSNVSHVSVNGLELSDIGSSGFDARNFGEIRLTNLDIDVVDSTAILASTGGLLEVVSTTITNARKGLEVNEVDLVKLTDNNITETESTAMIVSNAAPLQGSSVRPKSAAGDITAEIVGNEIVTSANDGILVSAGGLGSLVLDLRDNQSISSTNDYVLAVTDTAVLMLTGFAGGGAEAAAAYVKKTNLGSPRVNVLGTIAAGPTGQADVVAVEKTVSDPEPFPNRVIEYSVVVTNLGPAPALEVVVTDSLPDGLEYDPATIRINAILMTDADDDDEADFGATRPGTVTARLGGLSVSDTAVVTFGVRPLQGDAGMSVTNSASVTAVSPDSVASNNKAEVQIAIKLNTAVESDEIPKVFALRQNYPNPFNPATTIAFDLPTREFVRVTVLNVLGQPVAELIRQNLDAGRHVARWDARAAGVAATSGMYFYRIEAGPYSATRSMILVK